MLIHKAVHGVITSRIAALTAGTIHLQIYNTWVSCLDYNAVYSSLKHSKVTKQEESQDVDVDVKCIRALMPLSPSVIHSTELSRADTSLRFGGCLPDSLTLGARMYDIQRTLRT